MRRFLFKDATHLWIFGGRDGVQVFKDYECLYVRRERERERVRE